LQRINDQKQGGTKSQVKAIFSTKERYLKHEGEGAQMGCGGGIRRLNPKTREKGWWGDMQKAGIKGENYGG